MHFIANIAALAAVAECSVIWAPGCSSSKYLYPLATVSRQNFLAAGMSLPWMGKWMVLKCVFLALLS